MSTRAEVVDRCTDGDVDLLRLVYVGNDGVLRGKVSNAERVADLFDSGINVPQTTQSFTFLDHVVSDGRYANSGEARLVPDPSTFYPLPYAERTAIMVCDLCEPDGDPWAADPRSTLRSMLDDISARGYETSVAFESEFSLARETEQGYAPLDRSLGYSVDNMQETHEFVLAVVDALEALGMSFESYVPEYGTAQQEFVVEHAPALRAADQNVLFRQAVRAVATNQELQATFLPKPFAKAGNGCHVHISLWNDGSNLFYDETADDGLSVTARSFIAGVLEHAPGLAALTAPTKMSYERLRPGKWASAFACWGHDNREAAVRIPSTQRGRRHRTTRLEYKPADNTMNPYLALTGLLAAGMDGVENGLTPPNPVAGDPSSLADADDRLQPLPESIEESLEALEDDDVLLDALGDDLASSYLEVKHDEAARLDDDASEWDLDRLIRAF